MVFSVEDIDGSAMEPEKSRSPPQPRFASTKWETVDEAELEAQGNITQRWESSKRDMAVLIMYVRENSRGYQSP